MIELRDGLTALRPLNLDYYGSNRGFLEIGTGPPSDQATARTAASTQRSSVASVTW
jgi:hypothetical protein